MKNIFVTWACVLTMSGAAPALAADLASGPYTKALSPAAAYNWSGFYVFGGGGGGVWNSDGNVVSTGVTNSFGISLGPPGAPFSRDQRRGGRGWFGTVGGGFDRQFGGNWVAGVFGDAQFGKLKGSLADPLLFTGLEGTETLRASYAAGVRLGYLVAPNVLSYVNTGYSGSEWSAADLSAIALPAGAAGTVIATTPSFHRDGWFVGGGVENSLAVFGIAAPGWFMKSEYRSAFYNRVTLPETATPAAFGGAGLTGLGLTFKPWVQTISTSLVYRFDSVATTEVAARSYLKAPSSAAAVSNWNGAYIFAGGGGGLWAADSNTVSTGPGGILPVGPAGTPLTRDERLGGSGWFGTLGVGIDRQIGGRWVAGAFADGQFGDIRGSLIDTATGGIDGRETLRVSYAAGVRFGYLIAPAVLSYVNAGYSGSEWSGTSMSSYSIPPFGGGLVLATTPSFRRDGWFVGGGVENSLNIFGIAAPGWFMKTEYRAASYDRTTLPETATVDFFGGGPIGRGTTFKPWVQTISTSLVYRFK